MTCQGCDTLLTGKQTRWCSDACRIRAARRGKASPDHIRAVAKLLADNGIEPDDVGRVERIKLSEWDSGNRVLSASSVVLSPKWESGPEWPVVAQAKPTGVKAPRRKKASRKGYKTALILPDPQIGFRATAEGLDPFHDESAMAVAMQLVAELKPDKIVNLGDLLDLPCHGTYAQEPAFANTTQAAVDRAHAFLAAQRAVVPDADIELHEGNHDRRLPNHIQANAAASMHIRQANIPEAWPVLSVPHLLRLDELGISYIDGYPAGESWINDRLVCRHAPPKFTSAGSSALKSIEDERVSTIFGHVHRIELVHRTRPKRDGYTQNFAASVGCLCRIDGAVPSAKASVDTKGAPVLTHPENWQQAVGVVTYEDGDKPFSLEIVPIISGQAIFRGTPYAA